MEFLKQLAERSRQVTARREVIREAMKKGLVVNRFLLPAASLSIEYPDTRNDN